MKNQEVHWSYLGLDTLPDFKKMVAQVNELRLHFNQLALVWVLKRDLHWFVAFGEQTTKLSDQRAHLIQRQVFDPEVMVY